MATLRLRDNFVGNSLGNWRSPSGTEKKRKRKSKEGEKGKSEGVEMGGKTNVQE